MNQHRLKLERLQPSVGGVREVGAHGGVGRWRTGRRGSPRCWRMSRPTTTRRQLRRPANEHTIHTLQGVHGEQPRSLSGPAACVGDVLALSTSGPTDRTLEACDAALESRSHLVPASLHYCAYEGDGIQCVCVPACLLHDCRRVTVVWALLSPPAVTLTARWAAGRRGRSAADPRELATRDSDEQQIRGIRTIKGVGRRFPI